MIIKRQVGGGARATRTNALHPRQHAAAMQDDPRPPRDDQPFIPSIPTEGVFLPLRRWEFRHALVKRAAQGDYRIQEAYGGKSQVVEAAGEGPASGARGARRPCRQAALCALSTWFVALMAALQLMELEVIELPLSRRTARQIGAMIGKALRRRIG